QSIPALRAGTWAHPDQSAGVRTHVVFAGGRAFPAGPRARPDPPRTRQPAHARPARDLATGDRAAGRAGAGETDGTAHRRHRAVRSVRGAGERRARGLHRDTGARRARADARLPARDGRVSATRTR
ncbi:hypothetical protein BLX88_23875, partial [Bacillus obstructivus]